MDNFFKSQPWYINVGIGAAAAFALSMFMGRTKTATAAKAKGDAIAQYYAQMGTGDGYQGEVDVLDSSNFPDDTYTGESQGAYAEDELATGDSMYDVLMPAY